MKTIKPRVSVYSAVIGSGERPTVRICSAESGEVFSFRLLTREDVLRFVSFLNDNRIEAVHVKDCFHDFLFDLYAEP